ncbi:MAG: CAP domain-containing protein [Caldilinea sp.]|nr:CAP domain-containing protein [Caldilinea sp.]MDW8442855.1 CAP domain-containing protein [Caldilineaceae bacterium]
MSELQIIHLINLERRQAGLAPLRWNRELTASARAFAQDVIVNRPPGYCDHVDSQGRTPGERMRAAGFVRLGAWAENAVCNYTSPEAAVRAWMQSAAHRENLLNARLREIGVGYALSETNRGYIVADLAVDAAYAPVVIENEAPSTSSRQVNLYIYDPVTVPGMMGLGSAVEMMISNDPNFTEAVWQPFATETVWLLEEGNGWKHVYVKTRDALGRTAVAFDSIYLGESLPLDALTPDGASRFDIGVRLQRIETGEWPLVQFSLNWVGDDSDPNFSFASTSASRIEDGEAVGGTAVRLTGTGLVTLWTGDYLASLPGVAYFRLKVNDNTTPQAVAKLRVVGPRRELALRTLRGSDFEFAGAYQEFAVPYTPDADAQTVTFRVDAVGAAEVTMDAVTLFSAPVAATAPLQWLSPERYLRNRGVQARLLREDGAFSSAFDVHPASGILIPPSLGSIQPPSLSVTPSAVTLQTAETELPTALLVVECVNCTTGVWQASTAVSWLALSVTEEGLLEIRAIVEGLVPGIYQAEILISVSAESGVSPLTVPVTLWVGDIEELLGQKVYLPITLR